MIVLVAIVIFLFCLFAIAKDDFIFMRKNLSLSAIFDIAFFAGLGGLLVARIVFVATHYSILYLNPLVFFVIPYFPGLSGIGLFIGGAGVLYGIAMRKKLPLGRVFDVFSLSLLPSSGIIMLNNTIQFFFQKQIVFAGVAFLLCAVTFAVFFLLQKLSSKFSWTDGTSSLFSLVVVSVALYGTSLLQKKFTIVSHEFPFFLFFIFLLFVSFLIKTFKKTRGVL